jgi:hypothetical protein
MNKYPRQFYVLEQQTGPLDPRRFGLFDSVSDAEFDVIEILPHPVAANGGEAMVDITRFTWKADKDNHEERLEEVLEFIAQRLSSIDAHMLAIALQIAVKSGAAT